MNADNFYFPSMMRFTNPLTAFSGEYCVSFDRFYIVVNLKAQSMEFVHDDGTKETVMISDIVSIEISPWQGIRSAVVRLQLRDRLVIVSSTRSSISFMNIMRPLLRSNSCIIYRGSVKFKFFYFYTSNEIGYIIIPVIAYVSFASGSLPIAIIVSLAFSMAYSIIGIALYLLFKRS